MFWIFYRTTNRKKDRDKAKIFGQSENARTMQRIPKGKYSYFVRCCHDYLHNKERLFRCMNSLEPQGERKGQAENSEHDLMLQNILKEQIDFVDSSFEQLRRKDPILSRIMYLNLVENRSFDEISRKRMVGVSRRNTSRKYAKRSWEKIFNETVLY